MPFPWGCRDLELFNVLAECFLQFSQRIEHGCDPGSHFRIFVRKDSIITLTVEHCRSVPLANISINRLGEYARLQLPGG